MLPELVVEEVILGGGSGRILADGTHIIDSWTGGILGYVSFNKIQGHEEDAWVEYYKARNKQLVESGGPGVIQVLIPQHPEGN